jgi:trigger factor
MAVSVKELEGLRRSMTVEIPTERVDEAVETELKKLMQTVKINGFRKGKVPYSVVKRQFGDAVFHETVEQLIKTTWKETLDQQSFILAGRADIEIKQNQPHQPISYEATFEIYPHIEPRDLQGVKIEKLKSEVIQADVDRVLKKLQERAVQWREVERAAQAGDRVTIDFEGTYTDGTKIEGGTAKDFALVLGSKSMIPGFEQALLGSEAGNEINSTLTFPENYSHKDLVGKTVNFKIGVHKVEEPVLPEMNEEFAKHLGITEGGIEKLEEQVRESLTRELAQLVQNDLKRKIWKEWLNLNKFEIPQTLVELEINRLQEEFKQRLAVQGAKQQHIPNLPREHLEGEAKRRVQLGLLLHAFTQQHKMKIDPLKLEAKINEISAVYEHPQEMADWILHNKLQFTEIEGLLLEELALDKLLEGANVQEKFVACQDLVKLTGENEAEREVKDDTRTE